MALVPAVVDAVAPIPVVAAGGIGDGRGLAAVLMLGASAAWLGTRFVMSAEAPALPAYRDRLAAADATSTVYSSVFDVGWPDAPHRTLRNSTLEMWEAAGRPPSGERPGEGETVGTWSDGEPIVRYESESPRIRRDWRCRGDVDVCRPIGRTRPRRAPRGRDRPAARGRGRGVLRAGAPWLRRHSLTWSAHRWLGS